MNLAEFDFTFDGKSTQAKVTYVRQVQSGASAPKRTHGGTAIPKTTLNIDFAAVERELEKIANGTYYADCGTGVA